MHAVYEPSLSRAKRRKLWLQLLEQWKQTSQTQSAFCEAQQIKQTDLKRWLYRASQYKAKWATTALTLPSKPQSPFFLPVDVAPEPISQTLILQHCRGFSITLDDHTDDALLRKALHLLGELAC
jgi:hypothetical protein